MKNNNSFVKSINKTFCFCYKLLFRVLEDDNLEEKHQVFKGPDEGTKKIFDVKELKKITVNIIRKVPQKKGLEKPKILFDPTTVAPVRRPGK